MEETLLYELIAHKYIYDYREQLEKDDSDKISQSVIKARGALEKALDKDELKLVDDYLSEFLFKEGYIDLMCGTKILNCGIKLGMNMQKAFDEYDKD